MNFKPLTPKLAVAATALATLGATLAVAATAPASPPQNASESSTAAQENEPRTQAFGLSYFVFFNGPGLSKEMLGQTPNVLGLPDDDGLRFTYFLSLRYRLTGRWAADFQARIQWVLNNARDVEDFETLRWQAPRVGISGKIASGDQWQLTGAINTDFPYFLPEPVGGGYVTERRTTLFNPGMFAKFAYKPKASPWSVFSLVMPRMFFYKDRDAAEAQLTRAGFSPGLKPELTLSFSPSINYALNDRHGLRLGTDITYRKLVLSSWNPFDGSLNGSSVESRAWRLSEVPLQLGYTYEPSERLGISAYIQAYPIAAQRVRRDGTQASFGDTASVGMWLSGTLL